MLQRFVCNYLARHRHPANAALHLAGVPLAFVVSTVLLLRQEGWWALACFAGGYALQFVGHAIEGNDAGEVVLIKRLLGRPYVEFGPRGVHDAANPSSRSG
ncbi:MAG: DUF962 domain-containing protein [Planctomycetaceae bacterium]